MQLFRRGLQGLALIGLMWFSVAAQAQVPNPLITVDENGSGTLTFPGVAPLPMPGVLLNDPGPGGLTKALTYDLLGPPSLVAGDLVLLEDGIASDVIRFNPANIQTGYPASLVFYSDNIDGVDAIADTGFPAIFYTNILRLQEIGPEGNNGITYTPLAGQPGFIAGFAVTYNIKSDSSTVPEPGSIALLSAAGVTGVAFTFSRLRRRRK